jgi:hypothetical protein
MIRKMRLCLCLVLCALAAPVYADVHGGETVRGKLVQRDGQPPAIETSDGKFVALDGDEFTRAVIRDKRLNGFQIEAKGRFTAPGKFTIDPIHTRAILADRDGHKKLITYWCDVCAIRTYSPGPCWCCQEETVLDLRDPEAK